MALSLVAGYLNQKQENAKLKKQYAQDAIDNALQQHYLEMAQQKATEEKTTFDQEQPAQKGRAALALWDADPKNAQPDFADTKAYSKWAARRATEARKDQQSTEANTMASDYRMGEQAQEYGANAAYIADPKTKLTNAQAGLADAKTQFENAHTANEKVRYQHELQMVGARGAQQMEAVRMRTAAMLQASGQRVAASLGIAQMNDQTRDAISMATAMNAAQGRSETQAFQMAMQQYKQQSSNWQRQEASYNKGQGSDPGAAPTMQMPNMTINNMTPAGQQPVYVVMPSQNGGQPTVQSHNLDNNSNPGGDHKPVPAIVIDKEVPAVVQRLRNGVTAQSIVQQYQGLGVSSHDINRIMALAHAQVGPGQAQAPNQFQQFLHQHHWLGQ